MKTTQVPEQSMSELIATLSKVSESNTLIEQEIKEEQGVISELLDQNEQLESRYKAADTSLQNIAKFKRDISLE